MTDTARLRLRSIRRIADLRGQMKRIEEVRLGRLLSEEAELETKREVLIATLNDDTVLHGLFVHDMAARLKRVNERQQALQPLKAQQLQQVLVQARHARYAETMMDALSRQADAVEGKHELESLTEQFLAQTAHASLPQACPARVAKVGGGVPGETDEATETPGPSDAV